MKLAHTLLLAVGSGVSVTTLYLCQPILNVIAQYYGLTVREAGSLITNMQVGYALGLLFLIPLGDLVDKKRLILIKLALLVLSLLAAYFSEDVLAFFFANFAIGVLSTTAQDYILLGADLAEPSQRGQVMGTIVSGLVLGILTSRIFSGVICEHFGVKAVFGITTILVFIFMVLVWYLVPRPPRHDQSEQSPVSSDASSDASANIATLYFNLLSSMLAYLRNKRLVLSLLTHGLIGMVFSAFWTLISFHLSAAPFHFSSDAIGLFALVGLAGASAAPLMGRLVDKHGPLFNIPLGLCAALFAFVLMFFTGNYLFGLIAGAFIFDWGVQTSFVSHQSIVFNIDPTGRSRLNSIFMAGIFVFFALGSWFGSFFFLHDGWRGLMAFCVACSMVAIVIHLALRRQMKTVAHSRPII